jgi:hypothetical protein
MGTLQPKAWDRSNTVFYICHDSLVVLPATSSYQREGEYRIYNGDMTDWSDAFNWIGHQPWRNQRIRLGHANPSPDPAV